MNAREFNQNSFKYHEQLYDQFISEVEQLVDSKKWQDWLDFQAKFRKYSASNTLLIKAQKPNATYVASLTSFNRMGRGVEKGAKGIYIWTPITRKIEDEEETKKTVRNVVTFKLGSVFDISQTNGTAVPEIVKHLTAENTEDLLKDLLTLATSYGVSVSTFDHNTASENGRMLVGQNKIELADNLSQAQQVKTLAHELSHFLLHNDPNFDYKTNRPLAELEAESSAYLLCHDLGLDSSEYSLGYVATWMQKSHPTPTEIRENLLLSAKGAQKASKTLIKDLSELPQKTLSTSPVLKVSKTLKPAMTQAR